MSFEIGQVFAGTYPPEAALWCNRHEAEIVEVERKNKKRYFQILSIPKSIAEDEAIALEIQECEKWLASHDYIGTKIATGRATQNDYAQEIAEMNTKAEHITALRSQLDKIKRSASNVQ